MKILFFDVKLSGHHSEYIGHLVDYLLVHESEENQYYFVVHSNFSTQFPEIANKVARLEHCFLIEITDRELKRSLSGNIFTNSFSEYRIMNYYAKKYQVDHVFLLYFNSIQLALVIFRPSYLLSGILFLQFYRMSKTTFKDKLKYYRKYILTKIYSLNSRLNTIFILNDERTVTYLNEKFKTFIFKMLPDPISNLRPLDNFNIYQYYGIETNRKIFLHIGGLADRKGTFEVIDSAKEIDPRLQEEVAILIVGKAGNEATSKTIGQNIQNTKNLTNVTIIWDNQFVSNEMMKSLFAQCFGVLMPYKNAEASSGILGHAIASNKMVITTNHGLLKELVEENDLGLLIKEITPCEISKAITHSHDFVYNRENAFKLKEQCDPSNFSDYIISSMLNSATKKR